MMSRRRRGGSAVALAVLIGLGASACSDESPDEPPSATTGTPTRAPSAPEGVALPPAGAAFDYQLGGAYDPPPGVDVVVRDSTADPVPGAYSVCYVNGFQTQPGAEWPAELVLRDESGAPLVDPNWPDEHILDISTAQKREAVAGRQAEAVARCAAAGYQAVEFDNLDSYSRSEGRLDLDDAVEFATLLVAEAHEEGLAAAQKNTAELAERGRDEVGYDFAVTEECDRWGECEDFAEVYGEHVLNIEYTDDLRGSPEDVCARGSTPESTIVRDRDLVPEDEPEHVYRSC
jgi:hypothetical protein